jgi:hypothetical protein
MDSSGADAYGARVEERELFSYQNLVACGEEAVEGDGAQRRP